MDQNNNYKSFTDLTVYKTSRDFRTKISNLVKLKFPKGEKFQLENQIIRSSRSVTANIAEGYGRFYYKDNVRFCRIARGSLEETYEHIITAFDEGYITEIELKTHKDYYEKCLKLLNGYIRYLISTKKGKLEGD